MASRYKLKLKQLDFVSLVDDPAQPNAKCLLIKRALHRRKGAPQPDVPVELEGTARLVKTSDELGLAFFWAFTSTNPDGTDHYDLHGDAVQADNDMIKAAAEFMEKGGAVDEMHDSETTGRVVFAMPMTPEIAKVFGVETKTSGLMVAIRPSADAMAKLKAGEYRAVSIAGLGERIEARKSAGRVVKTSLFTNKVDGHQHKIAVCDDGSMYCEYATSAGATNGHSHGVVFENGVLTILADSGHTHELAEGQSGVAVVPADAIVVVAASASPTTNRQSAATAQAKSTRSAAPVHGDDMKIVVLSEAQHAHYSKLASADAEAFLSKSHAERDAVLADVAKADPVVYKTAAGVELRKSDGQVALMLAKQADEAAAQIAKQNDELAKAREAQQTEVYKARVRTDIPHLAKSDDVKVAVLKAIDGIADEKVRGEAIEMLKGADAIMKSAGIAKGENPGADPVEETAVNKLDALTQKYAADHKVDRPTARLEVMKTAEGKRLYAESVGRA